MKTSRLFLLAAVVIAASPSILLAQVDTKWEIHDLNRPVPAVVDPGSASTQDSPGHPPSDAVVLFDGTDLSKWQHKDGTAAKWKVANGYAEVVHKTGYIYTKQSFGDCQLHVEFEEPTPPHVRQASGNGMTSSSTARASMPAANSSAPPASRSFTTASSYKTTSSSPAQQSTASVHPTKRTRRNSRSACKITAIPCASGISGFAN